MKTLKILVVLICIVLLLTSCSDSGVITFSSDESALIPIKCTVNILKQYKVSENSDYPYAYSWDKYFSAYTESSNDKTETKKLVSVLTIRVLYKNNEVKELSLQEYERIYLTTDDLKSGLLKIVDLNDTKDLTSNGYEAFLLDYKSESSDNNLLEFFVSNNKITEDDYFGITIFGPYSNEEEKQMILDAIDSLKIQVG